MAEAKNRLPPRVLGIALVLPLATLVIGIVQAERHLRASDLWVFEITGYDPRDLLRGQYVEFRLRLNDEPGASPCDEQGPEPCCYCLEMRGAGAPPQVSRTTCSAAGACDGRLDVTKARNVRRFYVPEARARELENRLREAADAGRAQVVIAIDKEGTPQIVELRIDGLRVEGTGRP